MLLSLRVNPTAAGMQGNEPIGKALPATRLIYFPLQVLWPPGGV